MQRPSQAFSPSTPPVPEESQNAEKHHWNPYRHRRTPDAVFHREFGGLPSRSEREKEELLAAFVGEGNLPGVLAKLHPQPTPVSKLIPEILQERLASPNMALFATLKANWGTILITDFNARNTAPIRIVGTTLEIQVSNASLLYAFQAPILKNQILQRITQTLGDNRITAIRFIAPGR